MTNPLYVACQYVKRRAAAPRSDVNFLFCIQCRSAADAARADKLAPNAAMRVEEIAATFSAIEDDHWRGSKSDLLALLFIEIIIAQLADTRNVS